MTTTRPIAVQLWTLRDALAADFEGTLQRVAEIGYNAVEIASIPSHITSERARAVLDAAGLAVPSIHAPAPVGDDQQRVLDLAAAYGARYVVVPWLDPQRYWRSAEAIRAVVDLLNEASASARAAGLTLAYHNHHFEFEALDGRLPLEMALETLSPDVLLEIDTYWAKVGGADPAAVLRGHSARVPLLHVKDGPASDTASPQTAVGAGAMDYETLIPLAAQAEYLIVELDHCATDMMEAVAQSYTYLTTKGLAHGRR
jgi:sugar phosphate isomerase/epimerase